MIYIKRLHSVNKLDLNYVNKFLKTGFKEKSMIIKRANLFYQDMKEDIIKIYFKRSEISSNHREITVQGIDFDA